MGGVTIPSQLVPSALSTNAFCLLEALALLNFFNSHCERAHCSMPNNQKLRTYAKTLSNSYSSVFSASSAVRFLVILRKSYNYRNRYNCVSSGSNDVSCTVGLFTSVALVKCGLIIRFTPIAQANATIHPARISLGK